MEVQRLELAVKKAESTVNKERREEAERQALEKLHREEKEKRKAGKKAWWMKDGMNALYCHISALLEFSVFF